MKIEIKRWDTKEVIHSGDFEDVRECLEDGVSMGVCFYRAKLTGASLNEAFLNKASLNEAFLNYTFLNKASLNEASMDGASMNYTSLNKASLNGASLNGASLNGASLNGASLNGASLNGASMDGASMDGASMNYTSLNKTKIVFPKFPSIRTISSMNLQIHCDELKTEIMRWDMSTHPNPEKFLKWADGGDCPYLDVEYLFHFNYSRKHLKFGQPTMNWVDLCKAICIDQGWKIHGYLD